MTKQLILEFARLALLHLGNGYATLPPLRKRVVEKCMWMSDEEFDRLVAQAQLMPGAFSLNLAAVIGRRVDGRRGSAVAIAATVIPLMLLFLLLVAVFSPMRHWDLFESMLRGMRPALIGVLAVVAFRMGRSSKVDLSFLWVPFVVAVAVGIFQLAPLYILLLTVGAGFLYGKFLR
ncbi:MAG: chromate transporter [Bacteroidaceae bacterium]|nr:chromate transporter [Bacteroidaceae bacterium]MBR4128294.1 chromate transporter [Bacteroidaceae bacterium]